MATPFSSISQLGNSLASIKTNPDATTTQVKAILLHNTNTTAETVEINFAPNSGGSLGTAAAANRIYKVSLAADETLEVGFAFPLHLAEENDAIFAKSTTASKVSATVTGVTN